MHALCRLGTIFINKNTTCVNIVVSCVRPEINCVKQAEQGTCGMRLSTVYCIKDVIMFSGG